MTASGIVGLYYLHRYWYYGKNIAKEFDRLSEKEHIEIAHH